MDVYATGGAALEVRETPDRHRWGVRMSKARAIRRMPVLRGVIPVLAQEMVAARRQAARLRTDNRRLSEQVRELRATLEARERRSP